MSKNTTNTSSFEEKMDPIQDLILLNKEYKETSNLKSSTESIKRLKKLELKIQMRLLIISNMKKFYYNK